MPSRRRPSHAPTSLHRMSGGAPWTAWSVDERVDAGTRGLRASPEATPVRAGDGPARPPRRGPASPYDMPVCGDGARDPCRQGRMGRSPPSPGDARPPAPLARDMLRRPVPAPHGWDQILSNSRRERELPCDSWSRELPGPARGLRGASKPRPGSCPCEDPAEAPDPLTSSPSMLAIADNASTRSRDPIPNALSQPQEPPPRRGPSCGATALSGLSLHAPAPAVFGLFLALPSSRPMQGISPAARRRNSGVALCQRLKPLTVVGICRRCRKALPARGSRGGPVAGPRKARPSHRLRPAQPGVSTPRTARSESSRIRGTGRCPSGSSEISAPGWREGPCACEGLAPALPGRCVLDAHGRSAGS